MQKVECILREGDTLKFLDLSSNYCRSWCRNQFCMVSFSPKSSERRTPFYFVQSADFSHDEK